ncbi:MAG: M20/M25/M40 family metallo-hydrolase [Streptosporangiales bacterium]|nr:M20/M25/M40 family metallo-hydrolase [Streptosporangiales bacterium]
MNRLSRLTVAGVAIAAAATLTVTSTATAAVPDSGELREAVTADGIHKHLQAFQDIADANGDNRASGLPGYDESADYVADLLDAAGYQVTRQPFDFPFFQETAPPEFERVAPDARTYVEGEDFLTMEYSGSGDVTGTVQAVDLVLPPGADPNTSTSGCEASDFADFTAGNVALIQRGTCTFAAKAENAEAADASAVVIFNEGQEGRTELLAGTLGGEVVEIPVLGTTFAVGDELASLTDPQVHIATQTSTEIRHTENVVADTPGGRADRTLVVGAHLDSVPEGPGINDNGSGTAAILEIALQLAELGVEPTNRVRFAFWGAEESGLLGSEHYVANLSKKQRKDIMLNLNFDMVASPNYVRFVYDGDGSDTPVAGPQGSDRIEQIFLDYFGSQELATSPTAFDGRSDYGPFIAVGIPAGGLFTGAEGVKTADQAATYGGVAGAAYDPCYHAACDSLTPTHTPEQEALYAQLAAEYDMVGNVNMDALDEMSDATAHATLTFANTKSAVSGTARAANGPSTRSMEFDGHRAQR